MFDMRSREEAEGESRMMGSGRREGFLGCEAREEACVEGWDAVEGAPGRGGGARARERKISADLRTWEKSYV